MRTDAIRCLILGAVLTGLCGCTNPGRVWQAMKPGDYADPTVGAVDPWTRQAAVEGRGDRPREYDEEPAAVHNFLVSEKARAIEEDMGIYTR